MNEKQFRIIMRNLNLAFLLICVALVIWLVALVRLVT